MKGTMTTLRRRLAAWLDPERDRTAIIARTPDGCPVGPIGLRAGMAISASDYDHDKRRVVVVVEQAPDIAAAVNEHVMRGGSPFHNRDGSAARY